MAKFKAILMAVGSAVLLVLGILVGRGGKNTNRGAVSDVEKRVSELEGSNRDSRKRADNIATELDRVGDSLERSKESVGRIEDAVDSAKQSIDRVEQLFNNIETRDVDR